ncbi:SRPBCC family protein [Vibrio penaeicida]|uniref:SRPBCC family protein n=1 Tax=Vibrio penaeicida TaxID=104609 RepID=UPI002736AB1F|nr:SRPBCC family protein [Vibrio penaeicida]MDP2575092.1 SRPBCC family protein [Vibrio penaeicida]
MTFTTIFMSIVGILILLSVGALLLPRHIKVERNTLLPSGAKKVLELASSNRGYQQFNPYKSEDPNLKITHFGPETGVGSGFHFNGKDGKGSQTVASISDTSVQYNIDLGAMGQPTQMIKAEPNKNGVLVTWQMNMDLGMNPISRVFGLFMDKMVGKTFEKGLTNLARVV